ncbi:protein kinase [Achlya hypogyna]|uniref:Protein kinase n=1 Tax=Achlya hypogyna TaxID=1202772 RepID=A0A1V9ZAA2_ACHHY|nr:protein kinase [Achlya hypogyna]
MLPSDADKISLLDKRVVFFAKRVKDLAAKVKSGGASDDGNAAQLAAVLEEGRKKTAALESHIAALERELDTLKRMISATQSHNKKSEALEQELLEKFDGALDLSSPALDIVPTVPASDFTDAKMFSSSANYRQELGMLKGQLVIRKTFFSQTPEQNLLDKFVGALDLPARLDGADDTVMKLVATSGIGTRTPAIYIPYMAGGDLRRWLQASQSQPAPWETRLRMALQIARGVASVHKLGYIHRDVNALHVLVDADDNAKLLINSSTRAVSESAQYTAGVGQMSAAAPETVIASDGNTAEYSEKADIYSLGITLIELDTHEAPYSHMKNSAGSTITDTMLMQLFMTAKKGDKLYDHQFKTSPAWYQRLARSCVNLDPEARPTAAEVARQLQEHIDSPVRALSPHQSIELFVTVQHARNIRDRETFGAQTPFCKLTVGTDTFTTSAKERAGSMPHWNETFSFRDVHLMDMALEVNVLANFWWTSRQIGRCQAPLYSLIKLPAENESVHLKVVSEGTAQGYIAVLVTFAGPIVPYLDDYITCMTTYLGTIKGETARSKEIQNKLLEARRIRDLLDKP